MNKSVVIFFLSLLFFSCTSNTILKKPEDLIPRDQMIDVITDLLLANEAKGIKNENLKRNVNYAPLIYEKYEIDSLRFQQSNLYYTSKIDEYNEILNEVDIRLKALLDDFEADLRKKDSLERALRDSKNRTINKTSQQEVLEE